MEKSGCPGVEPLPVSATVWGLFVALSVICRVAVSAPATLGLKTRLKVQLAPAARVEPQVVADCEKSPAFVPVNFVLMLLRVVDVPLVRVTIWAELVVPNVTVPKSSGLGDAKTVARTPGESLATKAFSIEL